MIVRNGMKPPQKRSGIESLTPQQREVLILMGGGLANKAIANKLGISRYTAGDHTKNVMHKLGVSNRVQAAVMAAKAGLV